MASLIVTGGVPLSGTARVSGAKNAALPILAASILARSPILLYDCPKLRDVENMLSILAALGVKHEPAGEAILLDASRADAYVMPQGLSKALRSSIFMLGPLIARFGSAVCTFPGGCEIGHRPIDLHLRGLSMLGVRIREEHGLILCDGSDLTGADIHLDYPSVGATENIMMAAVLLKGVTTIHNAAREPEIVDLQNFLNRMGAKIVGAGTDTIVVQGVHRLHGVEYTPMADRIVAGTLMAAAAVTSGHVRLTNVPVQDMVAIMAKLEEMGCLITRKQEEIILRAPDRLRAFSQLQTQPHPGFPTDMQAQMMAIATLAKETSVVVENVFENRFAHAGDLNRMGARIILNGRTAVIHGVEGLNGLSVTARDLRGGAALAIAGLAARGETLVEKAEYIDRGYDRLEDALCSLGGDVRRIILP